MTTQNRFTHSLFAFLLCAAVSFHCFAEKPLIFGAMGDGPRGVDEWQMLEDQVRDLNKGRKYKFFVHVGDLWHGTDRLPESHYTRAAEILKQSRIPAYIVPGDNEWNDLDNPDEGWKFWTKTFYNFDENFEKPYTIYHQDGQPENIAFIIDEVLVLGINVVGGKVHDKAEWTKRHKNCADWVQMHLSAHKDKVRSAVIFAQARPNDDKQLDFFAPFIQHARNFEKPVLYLHGDGHRFNIETPWRAANVWRVQVDSVGVNPPLEVHVTHDLGEPFRFIRTFKE